MLYKLPKRFRGQVNSFEKLKACGRPAGGASCQPAQVSITQAFERGTRLVCNSIVVIQ